MLASSTVTSISNDHFDMSVLNHLDKVAGISIFNHLAPRFLTMAAALSLDKPTLENLKKMGVRDHKLYLKSGSQARVLCPLH